MVMNINLKADERDIFNFFASVGRINDIKLIRDKHTKKSKGIAYVEFSTVEAAISALTLNQQILLSMPVLIKPSEAEKVSPFSNGGPCQSSGYLTELLKAAYLAAPPAEPGLGGAAASQAEPDGNSDVAEQDGWYSTWRQAQPHQAAGVLDVTLACRHSSSVCCAALRTWLCLKETARMTLMNGHVTVKPDCIYRKQCLTTLFGILCRFSTFTQTLERMTSVSCSGPLVSVVLMAQCSQP
jgi:hypothetical protein